MHPFLLGAMLLVGGVGSATARQVQITVLNTTDLHGSVRRTPGVYAEHNEGSLLQCASLVNDIRQENPNTLLLDCGDIFQGTLESYLTQGAIMTTAMNAMGYDAFAVGNHEFDWGVETLGEMLDRMKATPLAANLLVGEEAPEAFRRVLPFVIKEVDGLKVAIVGLTNPNIPKWSRSVGDYDLRVVDSRRALEKTLPLVRKERPDLMILLVHQGIQAQDDEANEINSICWRFGEFDLILGGHLHWVLPGGRIGKADYAQAGSGGQGLMRIDLTYDTVKNKVVKKDFLYLPMKASIPEDPKIKALVVEDLAKADDRLNTVLGKTTTNLRYSLAMPGLCPVQQLLCKSIAKKTKAEVVLHGILSDQSIPPGDIRVSDVWKIVPYENTVGCLWLTPAEIRSIMEDACAYLGESRYFGTWGLQYEVYPKAPKGKRIRNLRAADGSALHGRRRIKTAINSYHLAGGGGRFPALVKLAASPHSRLEMGETRTRDMVMSYIKRHRTLTIPKGTNAVLFRKEPIPWQRKK
jgi:5'-nucleotidase / UDP-sugar diphosphatase